MSSATSNCPDQRPASSDDGGRRADRTARHARRAGVVLFALIAGIVSGGIALAGRLTAPYVDPAYYRAIPFGTHSHWAQPWRAYMGTVPAAVFIDGTGVNFNTTLNQAENVAKMLAKHGIHHARVEINWGSFAYDDESRLTDPSIAVKLHALKDNGIRPLILLNANAGLPCPTRITSRVVVRDARRGDGTLEFDNARGIVPGYTGLINVGPGRQAGKILITSLQGNVATLSRPLPVDIFSPANVGLATFKYRPFGAPGSADFAATRSGWQTYATNVARIVRAELGTTGKADGGFDIEIWNELTFDSEFLSIDNYYDPAPGTNPDSKVWGPIVEATAQIAQKRPDLFSGVLIGDGFANTIPWPASSYEPPRIDAIDKHPYPPRKTYPADDEHGTNVNAAYGADGYVPAYSVRFPEYYATMLQTETIVRDMGPFDGDVYGKMHGRDARVINGKRLPVSVWITEVNTSPAEDNPAVSADEALALKATTTARYFCFFLNKGVTQVDLYATNDRDTGLGIVRDNFLAYAEHAGAPYPADDRAFLSPALLVTGRISERMRDGLDRGLKTGRALRIESLSARADPVIFRGDGTPLHPDLRAVDVFAFLPFQVNAHRFVIPYYVMTRDVMRPWPEDEFSIVIDGFSPRARFSVYDPFDDRTTALRARPAGRFVRLALPTAARPRLLIVDEPPSPAAKLQTSTRTEPKPGRE